MTASRFWTSPDGRRTIDLDAVVLTTPNTEEDGDEKWRGHGCGLGVAFAGMSDGFLVPEYEADSFLAALKAWRGAKEIHEQTVAVRREHSAEFADAMNRWQDKFLRPVYDEVAAETLGKAKVSPADPERFGDARCGYVPQPELRGFNRWPGTPAPVGIELEFLICHGADACSLWGGFAENAPDQAIAWRYGCYRLPPNWREIAAHFQKIAPAPEVDEKEFRKP